MKARRVRKKVVAEEPPPHLDPALPSIDPDRLKKMSKAQREWWERQVGLYAEEIEQEKRDKRKRKYGY